VDIPSLNILHHLLAIPSLTAFLHKLHKLAAKFEMGEHFWHSKI
jgi:hypothetical protein